MVVSEDRWPICTLVRKRQYNECGSWAFQRQVAKFLLQGDKELLVDPEIISPHTQSISSLSVDSGMGRFVLAGSTDATISVYDLSYWGSEGFARQVKEWNTTGSSLRRFRPVARSVRVPWGRMGSNHPSALEIPPGHAAAIRQVQWYPVDTGIFMSYAADGCLLLWDTNRMEPVLTVTPFAESLVTTVTSLDRISPEMTLLSGSSDGMILTWGKPKGALFRPRQAVRTEDKDNW